MLNRRGTVYRRHDKCALFLDEGFGYKELAPELEKLGYAIICHQPYHSKKQGIRDEELIPLCASKGWLLTTTDKNMVLRHRDLLKKHRQSLIFTSNNQDKYLVWLDAFTEAKAKIERTWRKTQPPWVGRLHPTGFLEIFALAQYVEYQSEVARKRRRR